MCSSEKWLTYASRAAWGWVNHEFNIIFGRTIPLNHWSHMDYLNGVFTTFLRLECISCVGYQWRNRKLLEFIKNIFICVPKINKGLTGLERWIGWVINDRFFIFSWTIPLRNPGNTWKQPQLALCPFSGMTEMQIRKHQFHTHKKNSAFLHFPQKEKKSSFKWFT